LTADARTLITGDAHGNLVFWDMVENRERARVRAHSGFLTGLRLTPGDRLIVSWRGLLQPGEPGEVRIWDLATARELASLPCAGYAPDVHIDERNRRVHFVSWIGRNGLSPTFNEFRTDTDFGSLRPFDTGMDVTALAYSPDHRRVATGDLAGHIELRDSTTFHVIKKLAGLSPRTLALAFSHDGSTLAASREHELSLWNVASGRRLAELPTKRNSRTWYNAFQLRFASDDRRLLALDFNRHGLLLVADPGSRPVPVEVDELPTRIDDAGFSPDGQSLALVGNGGAALWSTATGQKISNLSKRETLAGCLAFPPAGNSLLLGDEDGREREWHLQKPSAVERIDGHKGEVWSLAFSPQGDRLISASDDHLIKIWDPRSGALVGSLAGHGSLVSSIAISPDGTRLASAGYDHTVRIWQLPKGEVLFTFQRHQDRVRGVAFSPDGQTLASGSSDGTVRIWDAHQGTLRHEIAGQKEGVLALAFDPWGRYVASSCDDGVIRCLDPVTAREAFRLPGKGRNYALTFSPEGSRLAAASEFGTITIWETGSWSCVSSLRSSGQTIRGLAFTLDGRRIAAGNDQGTVLLWDAHSGELLLDLPDHAQRINAVAFSPDGRLLATARHDGSIVLLRAGDQ
jgi:WD40 repeat protein